jgi:hypothetical protein
VPIAQGGFSSVVHKEPRISSNSVAEKRTNGVLLRWHRRHFGIFALYSPRA